MAGPYLGHTFDMLITIANLSFLGRNIGIVSGLTYRSSVRTAIESIDEHWQSFFLISNCTCVQQDFYFILSINKKT